VLEVECLAWGEGSPGGVSCYDFEGKNIFIGRYDDEEEAAVDYARAVFKYRGGAEGREHHEQYRSRSDKFVIDLNGVPPQPPIPKSSGRKKGASKYTGVYLNKTGTRKKWVATISLEGKNIFIGYYDEEEAAVDYARAVFKYRGGAEGREHHESFVIDLNGVPHQPPIPKRSGRAKEGASKYTGVSFHKNRNKWHAQIMIEGKKRHIGYYDDEEEAAVDFARAVLKYRG
jgi:hypothetical protein